MEDRAASRTAVRRGACSRPWRLRFSAALAGLAVKMATRVAVCRLQDWWCGWGPVLRRPRRYFDLSCGLRLTVGWWDHGHEGQWTIGKVFWFFSGFFCLARHVTFGRGGGLYVGVIDSTLVYSLILSTTFSLFYDTKNIWSRVTIR